MSNLTPRIDKLENNHLINGAFDFWQRGTSFTFGPATNGGNYYADRWRGDFNSVTNSTLTMSRSTDVPTTSTTNPTYSALATVTLAGTQNASSYLLPFTQYMEGTFFKNIHKNTITLQFWIKVSIAGTYGIALRNWAQNRSYATTFSVSAANTWTFISKVIQLDQAGTWVTDNTGALAIYIASYSGSTFQVPSNDSWQSGNYISASGITNWFVTGATVQVSEVAIYKGDLGNSVSTSSSTSFKLAGRTPAGELALCQRYYEKSYDVNIAPGSTGYNGTQVMWPPVTFSNAPTLSVSFKVNKRAIPTAVSWNPRTGASGSIDNTSTSTANTGSTYYINEAHYTPLFTGNITLGQLMNWHWTADAEL